jgi:hypothetical protein
MGTSYFSTPEEELDPHLFDDEHLRGDVRMGLMALLFGYLDQNYTDARTWAHAWIAGSGASYQWSAARQPGDLDVLVGVDYPAFKASNPRLSGLTDTEISQHITDGFRVDLQPKTTNWNGYEVTFYVNPHATDIRSINPYAAYDIVNDLWTVHPDSMQQAPNNREWAVRAAKDTARAKELTSAYSTAYTALHNAPNDAARRTAERNLYVTVDQAVALFDEIHHGRRFAFSHDGEGYYDWHNYRWQAGKESGVIDSLRQIKDWDSKTREDRNLQTYGMQLPDADVLIRRAVLYRSGR